MKLYHVFDGEEGNYFDTFAEAKAFALEVNEHDPAWPVVVERQTIAKPSKSLVVDILNRQGFVIESEQLGHARHGKFNRVPNRRK